MRIKPSDRHIMYLGIPVVGFVLSFYHLPAGQQNSFGHFLITIGITALYWVGSLKILLYFRVQYPLLEQTSRRLIFTFVMLVLYNALLEASICPLMHLFLFGEDVAKQPFLKNLAVNLLATFIVGILYESTYFYFRWKKQALVTEQLRSQQLRSQLNVLKNQISPHFLFNSLNTLITLIAEDQRNAIDFTERLSSVYRYILQNKDKELVDLATELEFTNSYLYLLKTRFADSLKLNVSLDAAYLHQHVAPLTLQMLVENAVKHNIISQNRPLHIDIFIENRDTIVVRNNLQLKHSTEPSTHTGLENIKRRYAYLSNKEVMVMKDAHSFAVALPLISLEPTLEAA